MWLELLAIRSSTKRFAYIVLFYLCCVVLLCCCSIHVSRLSLNLQTGLGRPRLISCSLEWMFTESARALSWSHSLNLHCLTGMLWLRIKLCWGTPRDKHEAAGRKRGYRYNKQNQRKHKTKPLSMEQNWSEKQWLAFGSKILQLRFHKTWLQRDERHDKRRSKKTIEIFLISEERQARIK